MKNFMCYTGIGVAFIAIGCLGLAVHKAVNKEKDNCTNKDNSIENYDTENLIKTSRTVNVLSKRYANFLIAKHGNKIKEDGCFLSVLNNWGLLHDDTLIEMTKSYFNLADYHDLIVDKFGEEAFTIVITNVINELSTPYKTCIYKGYNSIEEATAWERLIPYLEDYIIRCAEKYDYDCFEKVLTCLYSLYAQSDYSYFIKQKDNLIRIMNSTSIDSLSYRDSMLHKMTYMNKDTISTILSGIATKI